MVPEIDFRIKGIPHIAVEQGEDDRIRLIKRLATSSQESDCPSASCRSETLKVQHSNSDLIGTVRPVARCSNKNTATLLKDTSKLWRINVVPMGFFVSSAKGLPVLVFAFTFECNTGAFDVVLEKLHSNVRKFIVAMVW